MTSPQSLFLDGVHAVNFRSHINGGPEMLCVIVMGIIVLLCFAERLLLRYRIKRITKSGSIGNRQFCILPPHPFLSQWIVFGSQAGCSFFARQIIDLFNPPTEAYTVFLNPILFALSGLLCGWIRVDINNTISPQTVFGGVFRIRDLCNRNRILSYYILPLYATYLITRTDTLLLKVDLQLALIESCSIWICLGIPLLQVSEMIYLFLIQQREERLYPKSGNDASVIALAQETREGKGDETSALCLWDVIAGVSYGIICFIIGFIDICHGAAINVDGLLSLFDSPLVLLLLIILWSINCRTVMTIERSMTSDHVQVSLNIACIVYLSILVQVFIVEHRSMVHVSAFVYQWSLWSPIVIAVLGWLGWWAQTSQRNTLKSHLHFQQSCIEHLI